jgi:hypothetical protein
MIRADRPRALLIYPPVYDFALYDLFLKPFGLLRVEAWLRSGGWDTVFVNALDYADPASAAVLKSPKRKSDGTGKFFRRIIPAPPGLEIRGRRFARYGISPESFRKQIAGAGGGPDIILISGGMTYWYQGVREAAELCRAVYPGTPVAVGGVYASLMPEHCAGVCGADAVITGGDSAELGAFLENLGLPVPPGPYPEAPPVNSAAWKEAAVLRLSRGCPENCDYCAARLLAPRFEAGDPEAAFKTFTAFMDAGIRNFAFYDDALLVNKERVLTPFLERVIERCADAADGRPRFYLPNAVHIRRLDSRTAALMRKAGFQEIRMGFESSSFAFHTAHTASGAKFRPEIFPETVEMLRDAGFPAQSLSAYVLAGLPGQRAEEVEQSIRAARESGVRVRLAEFSPVPGSALWETSLRLCRFPLAEEPLYQNNSFFPMEWEGFTWEDLQRLKRIAGEEEGEKESRQNF